MTRGIANSRSLPPSASVSVEVGAAGMDQSLTATNRGAMGFWWSNQLGALTDTSGRELQLLRFPGGVEGMYLKPAMFWAMSAGTEHPEEAAKFIDFMLNSTEAAEIMLTDRGLPLNLANRDLITDALDAPNQQAAGFGSFGVSQAFQASEFSTTGRGGATAPSSQAAANIAQPASSSAATGKKARRLK